MWSQRITWTALPWGVDEQGRPRISAFASLRLGEDARTTLAQFPDVVDWATLVDGATFEVVAEPGGSSATEVLSGAAEPTLWRALFPDTSPVEPFEFRDHSAREIVSYGVRDVLTAIRDTYGAIAATSPEELPPSTYTGADKPTGPLDRLVQQVGGLLGVADIPKELPGHNGERKPSRHPRKGPRQRLRETFGDGRLYGSGPASVLAPESSGLSGTPLEFARAWNFHHRPETDEPYRREPDPAYVYEPPPKRELDFHDALALLADHPVLLRRLGLVVDLALTSDVVAADGRLRLVVNHGRTPDSRTELHTPWTRYVRTADVFAPGDAGDVRNGMLALAGAAAPGESPGDFDVVQIDPDSAALQVVNAASTMKALAVGRTLDYASFDTPETGSLPTLRGAGLAVVRSARGQALAARLQATKALDAAATQDVADPTAPPQTEVDADHLVRGWRIDVQRHRRGAAEPGEWLSLHRRRSTYLLRGATIGEDETDHPHEHRGEGYLKATSATSSPASTAMYLHESLARWAGWSLAVERPGRVLYPVEHGTDQDEVVERRRPAEVDATFGFEARHELVPGTLPALRFGDQYRLRARAVDLAGNALRADQASDAEASAWQELLRWEPVASPDLVARQPFTEGASLARLVIRSDFEVDTAHYTATGRDETVDERHVVAPQTSVFMAEAHGALDTPEGRPDPASYAVAKREAGVLRGTTLPWRKIEGKANPALPAIEDRQPDGSLVDRDPPGTYYVFDADDLRLPYLPEVPARGWAVRDAASGDTLEARDWTTAAWPDAPPIRLALKEAPAGTGPNVDWDGRVLTIGLEQAATLRLALSSTLDDRLAECFGVPRWARDHGADVLRQAIEGRHWMVTPPREVVLVHAVQRPLWVPEVLVDPTPPPEAPHGLWAERRHLGETFADLRATLRLHVRSTGQLGIDATWSEWSDDAQNPRPEQLHSTGRIANVPVPASLPDGEVDLPFWTSELKDKDRRPEPVRHEFGDTRHRWVEYTLRASTRFREYFPSAMHDRPKDLEQKPVTCGVHVRSSARPMAPRPRYAVPVVRWERLGADIEGWEEMRSERHGGGVRVWLERPWYSSGDEELLGVVLDPDRKTVPDELKGLISQVGRDPIWDTGRPATPLRPQDFAGDETPWRSDGLTLDERPNVGGLSAVGYEPTYDEQRRLWLADVWLASKARVSYTPFVRLALARYQPWSLENCHLSRVALLDFLQLLPTRTLTVRWIDRDTFDVVLCGVAPDGPQESRVEVGIEHHDGKIPGDLGWKPYPGHDAIRLDEGLIDEPEVDFELPGGFVRRAAFRPGVAERDVRLGRIAAESVPMVNRDLVADVLPGVELELERLPHEFPMWVLPGHRCWSARVALPARRGIAPQRLVVRELERIRSDHEALPNANIEYAAVGERVVYLETVRLGRVDADGI